MTKVSAALLLHPKDNVWIACRDVQEGEFVTVNERRILIRNDVPLGHKIAFEDLRTGTKIIRYGAPIGSLTTDIIKGDHIHTHNLKSDYLPSHDRNAIGLKRESYV